MLAVPTFVESAVRRKCVGSLLVKVSVGLAGGGGAGALRLRFPWMIVLCPTIRAPTLIVGAGLTLMVVVIVVIPGEDKLRFAEPCATPVTVKVTVSCPCGTVTVAGTVATPVLSEAMLNVMPPAGAAAEIVRVTFAVLVAFTLIGLGLNEPV